jgi:glutamate dehydrogenase/leucine dehydrogenase
MDVVVIGSGNVAQYFCEKCHIVGHKVLQVVARNPQRGNFLAELCNSSYAQNFNNIKTNFSNICLEIENNHFCKFYIYQYHKFNN